MKIKRIEIQNYKNFEEKVNITFNEEVNFIIGENNLGKSNFLKVLERIFNCKSYEMFKEKDFNNREKEINIILTLRLNKEEELGIFEDNFDPGNNYTEVNIQIKQEFDSPVEIMCLDSNTELKLKDLNKFNLFYIDSAKNKNTHLDFDKKIDMNSTLNLLLEYSLDDLKDEVHSELNNIKDYENIKKLLENLNNIFLKLHVPMSHNINVEFNDFDNLISKIFMLKDKKGIDIKKSGEGLKSLLYLELTILNRLFVLSKKKELSKRFDNILLFDEPEIHLHTYKQRSFIKYLLNNFKFDESSTDNNFKELVNRLFKVDVFERQIFIVTHSPNILCDDYSQLIRFYKEEDKIKVISGQDIEFTRKNKLKHFLRQRKDIKECLFSKGVIINEGETEVGAFKAFFETKGIDEDEEGIDIISVNGNKSVEPIKEILDSFKIETVGIMDRDNLNDEEIKNFNSKGILISKGKEFENDFIESLNENYFFEKIDYYEVRDFLKKSFLKDFDKIMEEKEFTEINKEKLLKILLKNKCSIIGYLFGRCSESIPEVYNNSIDLLIKKINKNE